MSLEARPVWVGVAIMDEIGNLVGWEMNANDAPLIVSTSQAGVYRPGPKFTPEELARILVDTSIHIQGKARRWGPGAGRGSDFRIPERPREIGS